MIGTIGHDVDAPVVRRLLGNAQHSVLAMDELPEFPRPQQLLQS